MRIDLIKEAARNAAIAGKSLNDACPYPWHSDAGVVFKEEYLAQKEALGAVLNSWGK